VANPPRNPFHAATSSGVPPLRDAAAHCAPETRRELCLIAGQSQRTAEFLAAGFSEAQVRRALLDARADQPEIASRITADAGTSQRPENSPVVAAVKKLTAKE